MASAQIYRFAIQPGIKILEYNSRAAQHAFLAGKGDVRGQDDVGRVQQGLAVVQRRLAIIHIHRRASQMAAAQRVAQRLRADA